ncbi:hypothetical protein EON67_04395 [archaeon]|nr:MAG: hypothetical protein EON67_04395 [archaeon]
MQHAPGYLNYIYRAGSVALAFLIASIVLDLLALYLLHRSARQTHMLRALLTNKIMLPLLYLLLFIFSVLAWASWVGLFKNKFDAQSLALTSGSLSSPDHGYSGGFALTVIASILSLINAILCFLFLRRLFHHNTANAATAAPTTAGAHTVPPAVY